MTVCQRWRHGRARYRPAGEIFDAARASVQPIDETTAKAFTVEHHYAHSYPAARVIPHWFEGLAPARGAEIGRLVLLDDVASNAESWFVARAFRLLRDELAGVHGILSYSDQVERVNAAGEVVKRGHIGTVYQALNAAYLGLARGGTMILARDGRIVSRRALSKLRNDESGAGYAYAQLLAMGAPERKPFEGGREYAERALREGGFRAQRHPGNHTYAWWLGDRAQRPAWQALPYPRRSGDVDSVDVRSGSNAGGSGLNTIQRS